PAKTPWPSKPAGRSLAEETAVRCAFEATGHKGPVVRQNIVIGSPGILGGDSGASIAFVQISAADDILVIRKKTAIIGATRPLVSSGACSLLHPVTGLQPFQAAMGIVRGGVGIGAIDGKAICGIADQSHLLLPVQPFQQCGRQSMI